MSSSVVAIWRPDTTAEVDEVRDYAGLYRAGVVEVWDEAGLIEVMARRDSGLVIVDPGPHAVSLENLSHPENAVYLLRPLTGRVPQGLRDYYTTVRVETPADYLLRPSLAGAITLHHRFVSLLRGRVEA